MKCVIEADGGSRGNPGIAGSGTVIYAADHESVLQELSYVVGTSTNNVAEYHALLNGLRYCAEHGASEVDVYMDSKLVVKQMSGRWKIKHPDMKALAVQARQIMKRFHAVTFTWVPRARNSRADALANKAMDAAAKGAKPGFLEGFDDPHAKGVVAGVSTPASSTPAAASSGAQASASPTSRDGASRVTDSKNKAAGRVHKKSSVSSAQLSENQPGLWAAPETSPTTTLLVLRHGETPYSVKHQYCGLSDPELTQKGHAQAQAAAGYLQQFAIDRVVSSPLRRTRQTAQAVTSRFSCEPKLIEQDFGHWEGLTYAEAADRDPEVMRSFLSGVSVPPPGGESMAQVYRRVKEWQRAFVAAHPGETILVVTHMSVAKSLVRLALGADSSFYHCAFLDLASLCRMDFGKRSVLRSFNETAYLANIHSGK